MDKKLLSSFVAFSLTIAACLAVQHAFRRTRSATKQGKSRDEKNHKTTEHVKFESMDSGKDDCASCNDTMFGSVKNYNKHVLVYDFSEAWAKKIENDKDSAVYTLTNALHNAPGSSAVAIKVTAVDARQVEVDYDKSFCTIVIYPEAKILKIPFSPENIEKVAIYLVSSDPKILTEMRAASIADVAWKRLILVCVHQSRDKRCGRAGPQIVQAMKEHMTKRAISNNDVMVLPSSHIGGHEYAGTLITYPSGNWYGRISKVNAVELLECVLNDSVYVTNLRGCPAW